MISLSETSRPDGLARPGEPGLGGLKLLFTRLDAGGRGGLSLPFLWGLALIFPGELELLFLKMFFTGGPVTYLFIEQMRLL